MTFLSIKNKVPVFYLVLILILISIFLYKNTISLFPSFVHAWTQSDRYAIALQFLDNGFDFFHPATFNQQTINGITRVDFPLNEFVVAMLMKLLGTTAPAVFRMYTLGVSIIGLVFLYLFSKQITGSFIKSVFIVLFVFLSPVYTYYQIGFLPTIPAIAFVFIAYYYFFSYKESGNNKQLMIAIAFFLLAALVRLPFIIFLFAAFLQQFWFYIKQKKYIKTEYLYFISAFIIFISYFLYNIHLSRIYGNMFLDSFLPAKNINEFKNILKEIYLHWRFHYFTIGHYLVLFLLLMLSVISFYKRRFIKEADKKYWFHLFIIAIGTFIYFLLMARQYHSHDYYFLDSFFIPIVLLLILLMKNISLENSKQKRYWNVFFIIFLVLFFIKNKTIQAERYHTGPWDRVEITHQNFIGTDVYLDSLQIPKDAKILVIDAYTTNAPLILMNRKGYTVLNTGKQYILTALFLYDWDYVAIQDIYLVSDVIQSYPLITSLLQKVHSTGKVSFYKWDLSKKTKTLKEFLSIEPQNTLYSTLLKFNDTLPVKNFSALNPVLKKYGYNSSGSAILDSTTEYGATFSMRAKELNNSTNLKILVSTKVNSNKKPEGIQLVTTVSSDTKTIFYQTFTISDYMRGLNTWQSLDIQFILPSFNTPNDELKVYLWNPSKSLLYYDDLEIVIYK